MYDFETTSVILNIRIYWGDRSEFWNGNNMTTYFTMGATAGE